MTMRTGRRGVLVSSHRIGARVLAALVVLAWGAPARAQGAPAPLQGAPPRAEDAPAPEKDAPPPVPGAPEAGPNGKAKPTAEEERRAAELVRKLMLADEESEDLEWLYSRADEYAPSGLTGKPIPAAPLPRSGGGSPRRWDPRWHKFSFGNYLLTGLGFGVGLGSYFIPPAKNPWRATNPLDDWGRRNVAARSYESGRWAQDVSDVLLSLNLGYPLIIDSLVVTYWYRRSPELAGQLALITLEAAAVASLIQGPSAALFSRERPYGRDCGKTVPAALDDCSGHNRYRSYYSGHASMSFAAAAVTCSYHARHDLFGNETADGIACGAAMASAATVGAMRVVAQKHYLSDVLTGAAVGTLSGFGVPWLLHFGPVARTASAGSAGSFRLAFYPLPGGISAGGTF